MTITMLVDGEPAFRTRAANPYNARLYEAIEGFGPKVRDLKYRHLLTSTPNVVHLHWPELTFLSGHRRWRVAARLVLFFSMLRIARLRGARLIWTAHNVAAHEERSTPALRRWYRRLWCANVDGVLTLTGEGVRAVRVAYPELAGVPAFVTPHGHYRDDYDFTVGRREARARLGIDNAVTVIATLGQIRPYKNVPALVEATVSLDDPGLLLVVAGRPDSTQTADALRLVAGDHPSVRLELGFVSDDRMTLFLRASDLVVLPYRAIQNSGSAILALSADRPVVVPAIGAMTELAAQVGSDWVHTYAGDFTPDVLMQALRWMKGRNSGESPDLSDLDWQNIASLTVSAYQSVVSQPRLRRRRRASYF